MNYWYEKVIIGMEAPTSKGIYLRLRQMFLRGTICFKWTTKSFKSKQQSKQTNTFFTSTSKHEKTTDNSGQSFFPPVYFLSVVKTMTSKLNDELVGTVVKHSSSTAEVSQYVRVAIISKGQPDSNGFHIYRNPLIRIQDIVWPLSNGNTFSN